MTEQLFPVCEAPECGRTATHHAAAGHPRSRHVTHADLCAEHTRQVDDGSVTLTPLHLTPLHTPPTS